MNNWFAVLLTASLLTVGLYVGLGFRQDSPLGIAFSEPTFGETGVTNTQVSCNTTTTLLLASSTPYSSFMVSNLSANTIYLCRSASLCSATSGIAIHATTSPWVQVDGYRGTYRCAAVGAASNLNVSYSR